jgi:hypothetical protein
VPVAEDICTAATAGVQCRRVMRRRATNVQVMHTISEENGPRKRRATAHCNKHQKKISKRMFFFVA